MSLKKYKGRTPVNQNGNLFSVGRIRIDFPQEIILKVGF